MVQFHFFDLLYYYFNYNNLKTKVNFFIPKPKNSLPSTKPLTSYKIYVKLPIIIAGGVPQRTLTSEKNQKARKQICFPVSLIEFFIPLKKGTNKMQINLNPLIGRPAGAERKWQP